MSATAPRIDFAESRHVAEWFAHPVLGDVSFDAFERHPSNPIVVGKPPLEWPVDGFLFCDPVSGNWFLYVGAYMRGYWTKDPHTSVASRCHVMRSRDRGRTWENLGAIWPEDLTMFDSDGVRPGHLPDVSVVYADGKYHLIYDYVSLDRSNDGIAYAVADRPEGPFVRARKPIHSTLAAPLLFGKYRRTYAQTLFRRKKDWLILAMMDGAKFHSWAYVAMTASRAEGPYSPPVFIRCVDHDLYHPALMESYPAFAHGGYVYAPCTSVALNRNFQLLLRVPIEEATRPETWEIVQEGSLWHSEDVPHEHGGIWGQPFSGFVDEAGVFQAFFPSLTKESLGTIGLASRRWNRPMRERGFHFSGHMGPSLTFVRRSWREFRLEISIRVRGTARIIWGYHAPVGPDRPQSNSTLHALTLTRYDALELGDTGLAIVTANERGETTHHTFANARYVEPLIIERDERGRICVRDGSRVILECTLPSRPGAVGLLAMPDTHVEIQRFAIAGVGEPLTVTGLPTEGLIGAGVNMEQWDEREDEAFRFGTGVIRKEPGGRAKWNFIGSGFSLWSPLGPEFGTVEVLLDGKPIATLDLRSPTMETSRPLLSRSGLPPGRHAVVLRAGQGRLVVDTLDVICS